MRIPRALRIVIGIVAGLVLAAATLYFGAYFALASTPGRDALKGVVMSELEKAGVPAQIADVRWGPAPGSIWACGVEVELPMATVSGGLLEAAIDLPAIAPTRVAIHVQKVTARIPEPGEEPPVVASSEGKPKGPKKKMTLPDVWLVVDELDLSGPGFAAHVRDVHVQAALDDTVSGTLTTGACHVTWMNGRRVVGFDACTLKATYAQSDKRVRVEDFALLRGGDAVVRAHGALFQGAGHFEADLDLAGWDAAALAGDQLPLGLVVQGLSLDIGKDTVGGDIAALHAPIYMNGPFTAELVDLSVERFDAQPGLLVPEVKVRASNLEGVRAAAFDWVAENVHAPSLEFALQKKLEGQLPAVRIDRWLNPAGVIGPIEADVDLAIGLSGGTVTGLVATPNGTLDAQGKLKHSPITKRSSFVATAAFANATGPLAALVRHDADDALKEALGEPLSGTFELAVEVEHESKRDPYELTVEWDATDLYGKAHRSWDGSEWVEDDTEEAPE